MGSLAPESGLTTVLSGLCKYWKVFIFLAEVGEKLTICAKPNVFIVLTFHITKNCLNLFANPFAVVIHHLQVFNATPKSILIL